MIVRESNICFGPSNFEQEKNKRLRFYLFFSKRSSYSLMIYKVQFSFFFLMSFNLWPYLLIEPRRIYFIRFVCLRLRNTAVAFLTIESLIAILLCSLWSLLRMSCESPVVWLIDLCTLLLNRFVTTIRVYFPDINYILSDKILLCSLIRLLQISIKICFNETKHVVIFRLPKARNPLN